MGIPITRVRAFSKKHDYDAFSVIRVHASRIEDLGGRGTWVRVSSVKGKPIYRRAIGLGGVENFTASDAELDYDSRAKLEALGKSKDDDRFYSCDLTLRRATTIESLLAHWQHPDPAYRLSIRIALLSLGLGILSLLIAIFK
jgi:hypothetical protein